MAGTVLFKNLGTSAITSGMYVAVDNGTTTTKGTVGFLQALIPATGVVGQVMTYNAAGSANFIDSDFSISYAIDGAGALITNKRYPGIEIPKDGTIEGWRIHSGTWVGNGTVDIEKCTYAALSTSVSIIGTGTKPSIAGANKATGAITTWGTTTFSKGDWIFPTVSGIGTIQQLTAVLYGKWTATA
jgi:hypothetical protein